MNKKITKILGGVLACTIALTSINAIPVEAAKVFSNGTYTGSAYDINKDGHINVFDLILMKRYLLGEDEASETEVHNAEVVEYIKKTVNEYICSSSEEYFARIKNIEINADTRNGDITDTAIVIVEFDKALTERAIMQLSKDVDFGESSDEITSLAGKCKYIRMSVRNGSVESVVPSTDSAYDTQFAIVTPYGNDSDISDENKEHLDYITYRVKEHIYQNSAEWAARITGIELICSQRDNGNEVIFENIMATVTFDTPLTERAIMQLSENCDWGADPEKEVAVYAGKTNKMRISTEGIDTVAVPILNDTYSENTTFIAFDENSEADYVKREVKEYVMEASSEWYTRINTIDVALDESSSTGTAIIAFDRPLTERAVYSLIKNVDDIESEVAYAIENKANKVKVAYSHGSISAVVAYVD